MQKDRAPLQRRRGGGHPSSASSRRQREAIPSGVGLLLVVWSPLPVMALLEVGSDLGRVNVAAAMLGISVVTILLYASDKRKAQARKWRIPESTLHWLAFLGGWPAALVAQRLLRHKTAKKSFQRVFWMIGVIHQCIALDCLLKWRFSLAAVGWVSQLNSSG